MPLGVARLELLTHDEVELASAGAVEAVDLVETVAPVHAEETEDWEEDTDAAARRAFEVEGAVILELAPAVARLRKGEDVDSGLRLERDGETEFERVLVVDIAVVGVGGGGAGRERSILVATEADCLLAVGAVTAHAIATHDELAERRLTPAVVVAEEAHLELAHEDELAVWRNGLEDLALERPLVVLNETVELLLVVLVSPIVACEGGVWWSELHTDGEIGAAAGEDGVVERVAGERDTDGYVVALQWLFCLQN